MNKLGEWISRQKLIGSADKYLDLLERSKLEGAAGLTAQQELLSMGNAAEGKGPEYFEKFADMVQVRRQEREARAMNYISGAGQF